MAKAKAFTTRVYKYGAIPLGPFPTEGVDQLFRANQLWNKLVEIHNEHSEYYDQARRDADEEYNTLSVELDNVEERVKKTFTEKRNARNKASSRDADHPLIKAANDKIDALFFERRELWDGIKAPLARAATADRREESVAFRGTAPIGRLPPWPRRDATGIE